MPDLAELTHELSQELHKQTVYWGIDQKDKRVIQLDLQLYWKLDGIIVGRFLRIIHYGKTINQNLRDESNQTYRRIFIYHHLWID